MQINNTPHTFLKDSDLSEAQIYLTIQTYNRFAKEYAEKWEWNPKTIQEIKKYNIEPFAKHVKKGGNVLILGVKTGRDYDLLSKKGYLCIGVDRSQGLLKEALRRVPNGLFLCLDYRSLPFMPESFDAVYADGLTQIPKKNIKETLKDLSLFLKPKGTLYLSLKLGENNVLSTEDLGDKRYFTLFRKKDILKLVVGAGFSITWAEESTHTDPSLPKWFSLIARKK